MPIGLKRHYQGKHICIMGLLEGIKRKKKEKKKGKESIINAIMIENSQTWGRKWGPIFVKPKGPNRLNLKRATLTHFITKLSKFKDKKRVLKAARENQLVIYNRTLIGLSANCSIGSSQV